MIREFEEVSRNEQLLNACENGDLETVKTLVEEDSEGTLLNNTNNSGYNSLMVACQYGQIAVVKYLTQLEAHSEMLLRSHTPDHDWNPLMVACRWGHHEVVEYLAQLEPYADTFVSHRDKNGKNAIELAKDNNHTNVMVSLLNYTLKYGELITRIRSRYVPGWRSRRRHRRRQRRQILSTTSRSQIASLLLIPACKEDDLVTIKTLVEDDSEGTLLDYMDENGRNLLMVACQYGSIEVVKYLTQHTSHAHELLSHTDNEGSNPLIFACWGGDIKVVKYLTGLTRYAKKLIEHTSHNNSNPLMVACSWGRIEVVEYLTNLKPYVRTLLTHTDNNGQNCLMHACQADDSTVARYLVRLGDHGKKLISHTDKSGMNPLMVACSLGNTEAVKFFTELDDYVEELLLHTDKNGKNPLIIATENGHLEVVTHLSLHTSHAHTLLSGTDNQDCNAFMWACAWGHVEVVEHLTQLKCHAESLLGHTDNNGRNALMIACQYDALEVVIELTELDDYAETLLTHTDKDGGNALMYACLGDEVEVTEYLTQLEHYSDVLLKHKAKNGWNPLMVACYLGNTEVIDVLLQLKDKDNVAKLLDHTDNEGSNALIIACRYGQLGAVKCLTRYQSYMSILLRQTDQLGRNALYVACQYGHLEVVTHLTKLDDHVELLLSGSDNHGRNCLMAACRFGQPRIVEHLTKLKHATNLLHSTDYLGINPLMFACWGGHLDVVIHLAKLKEHGDKLLSYKSNNGFNSLMVACRHGHLEVAKFLITHQPSLLDDVDENGRSALTHMALFGNVEKMQALIEILEEDDQRNMHVQHTLDWLMKNDPTIENKEAILEILGNYACAAFVAADEAIDKSSDTSDTESESDFISTAADHSESPSQDAERQYQATKRPAPSSTKKAVSETLRRFWQEVLALSTPLPDDELNKPFNKFDGSDKKAWHKLLAKINRYYTVSTDGIETYASLNQLVGNIEDRIAKRQDITMRYLANSTQSTKKPRNLFIMYPIMGSDRETAMLCRDVAGRSLDKANISLYTLRSPVQRFMMEDGNETLLHTMKAQAKIAVEGIRAVQKDGPYHLCGWSYGGVLAWEVARQLKADGDTVKFISLIDPQLPHTLQHFTRSQLINRLLMHINYATSIILDREDYKIITHDDFKSVSTSSDDTLSHEDGVMIIEHAVKSATSGLETATATPTEKQKQKLTFRYATLRANYLAMYRYNFPDLANQRALSAQDNNAVVFVAGKTAEILGDKPEYGKDDITPFTRHPEEYIVAGANHFDIVFGREFTRYFKQALKHLDSRKLDSRILNVLDAQYQLHHFSHVSMSLNREGCLVSECPPRLKQIKGSEPIASFFMTQSDRPRRALVRGDKDSGLTHAAKFHLLNSRKKSAKRWKIYLPLAKVINHIALHGLPKDNIMVWLLHTLYFVKAGITRDEVQTWWRDLIKKPSRTKQLLLIVDNVDKLVMLPEAHLLLEIVLVQPPCDVIGFSQNINQHVLAQLGFHPDSIYEMQPLKRDDVYRFINHMINDDERARSLRNWLKSDVTRETWARHPRHLQTLCETWLSTNITRENWSTELTSLLAYNMDNALRGLFSKRPRKLSFSDINCMPRSELRKQARDVLDFHGAAAYMLMVSDTQELSRDAIDTLLKGYERKSSELFIDVLYTGLLTPRSDNLIDIERSYGFRDDNMLALLACEYVITTLNSEMGELPDLATYLRILVAGTPYDWLFDKFITELNACGVTKLLKACDLVENPQQAGYMRMIMRLSERAITDDDVPDDVYKPLLAKISNTVVAFTKGVEKLSGPDRSALPSDEMRNYYETIGDLADSCHNVMKHVNDTVDPIAPEVNNLLEDAVKKEDEGLISLLLSLNTNIEDVRSSLEMAKAQSLSGSVQLLNEHLVKQGYQSLRTYLQSYGITLNDQEKPWRTHVDEAIDRLLSESLAESSSPWYECTTEYEKNGCHAWITDWQLGIADKARALEPAVQALIANPETFDSSAEYDKSPFNDALLDSILADSEAVQETLCSVILEHDTERYESFLFEHCKFSDLKERKIHDALLQGITNQGLSPFDEDVQKATCIQLIKDAMGAEFELKQDITSYVADAIRYAIAEKKDELLSTVKQDMRFILMRTIELYQQSKIALDEPIIRLLHQALTSIMLRDYKAIVREYTRETWLKAFGQNPLSEAQEAYLKHIFGYEEVKALPMSEFFSDPRHYTKGEPCQSLYGIVAAMTDIKKQTLRDRSASLLEAIKECRSHDYNPTSDIVRECIKSHIATIKRLDVRLAFIRGKGLGGAFEALLLSTITQHPIFLIDSAGRIINCDHPLNEFRSEPIFLHAQYGKPYALLKLRRGITTDNIMARLYPDMKRDIGIPKKDDKEKEVVCDTKPKMKDLGTSMKNNKGKEPACDSKPKVERLCATTKRNERRSSITSSSMFKKLISKVPGVSRTGLKMENRVKQLLKTCLPRPVTLGKAADDGDCFFDALAQWANILNDTTLNETKMLRDLCFEFYNKNTGLVDYWNSIDGRDDLCSEETYSFIQYTADECRALFHNRSPIWGRPGVEGIMLCRKLELRGILVIEVLQDPESGDDIPSYHLVTIDDYKSIPEDRLEQLLDDPKIPILINTQSALHFVPVMREEKLIPRLSEGASMSLIK